LKKTRRKGSPQKGRQKKMKTTIGARLSPSVQRLLMEFLQISGASKSLITNAAIEEMVPIWLERLKGGRSWFKPDPANRGAHNVSGE
jgi:hypothetical protein